MQNFNELGLPQPIITALEQMNFTQPTPIQAQAIPHALEGRDILGSARTGTGKTGAFGIPLAAHLVANPKNSALILTPTRELAMQVAASLDKIMYNCHIKSALLIGGDPMPKQLQQLRARPRLIVGTPGRINDHLERGSLMLHNTSFLVLDETDRMLDMGFGIQLDAIAKYLTAQRQTLMFSATLPKNIMQVANKYLKDPVRVSIDGEKVQAAANLKQEQIKLNEEEKYPTLFKELEEREGSVVIFVKTKRGAEKLAKKLYEKKHSADALHGDLRQSRREKVVNAFRKEKFRILVATDIAARGLDIPHVMHVINYDMPQNPEDYIHRIGRTARNGSKGTALNFICPSDNGKWRAIERMMNPDSGGFVQDENKKSDGRGQRRRPSGGRDGSRSFDRSRKPRFDERRSNDRRQSENRPFKERTDEQPTADSSKKLTLKKFFGFSGSNENNENRRENNRDGERRNNGNRRDDNRRSDERRSSRPDDRRRSDERSGRPDDRRRSDERSSRPDDRRRSDERSSRPDDRRRSDERRSSRPDDRRRSDERSSRPDDRRRDDNRRNRFGKNDKSAA